MNVQSLMFLCILFVLIATHECSKFVRRGNKKYFMYCLLYYKHQALCKKYYFLFYQLRREKFMLKMKLLQCYRDEE